LTRGTRGKIRIPIIVKALTGTRPAAYHRLQISAARVRVTIETSSTTGTLTTELRIITQRDTDLSASTMTKETATSTTPTMTNLPDDALRMEGTTKEESRFFTMT
jgi:hypothetical protein